MTRGFISLVAILLYVTCAAQNRPTSLPSPNSRGYAKWGYIRGDSALLMGYRNDTLWSPITSALIAVKYSGRDTSILYFHDGIKWKPAGGEAIDSFYYQIRQLNDTTALFDRGDGIVDTIAISGSGGGSGGSAIDTASLSNRINTKLNISDTAAMLLPYLRKADTVGAGANYIRNQFGTQEQKKFSVIQGKVDALDFNTTSAIADSTQRLTWDNGNGTLNIGLKGGAVNLAVGQEQVARVYNGSGSDLVDGELVYITGAQGNRVAVSKASNANAAVAFATIGMATEPIANGAEGFITILGTVNKLNTAAIPEGTELWLGATAGTYTTTKPTYPASIISIGHVERSHATVGSIYVNIRPELPTVASYGKNAAGDSTILLLTNGQRFAAKDSTGSPSWSLTGNAGTNPSTNFIGTTDNQDFVIRRQNTQVARFYSDRLTIGDFTGNAASSIFIGSTSGLGASNATGSLFLGISSGFGATNASSSIFIGSSSGRVANAANSSVFIGNSAGNGAVSAEKSVFLGPNAGESATAAAYSFIAGASAGKTFTGNSIGANNIIIGTNISLPNAASNAINIGNVLYGANTYSSIIGNPSITPQTNGQIGIKVVTPHPSAAFEVGGTNAGVLFPRLTAAQRNAISTPATSLLVFDTDSGRMMLRTASTWRGLQFTGEGGTTVTASGATGNIQFKGSDGNFSSNWQLQYDSALARVGISVDGTPLAKMHVRSNGIGSYGNAIAADSAGILLGNITAPTSYATIQNSPPLVFVGQAWTGSAATAQNFRILSRPAGAGTGSTGQLVFQYGLGTGAYTDGFTINADGNSNALGNFIANGNISSGGSATFGGTVTFNSTSRGAILNRLTTAQRNAIASPTAGETLYCTDCTATDGSTGVEQTYNGSTWKNKW